MTETVKLVRMVRHADTNPAPHAADVHPDEVQNYRSGGWTVAEGKTPEASDEVAILREQITALGGTYHHKAGVEKLTEILSALTAPAGEA